MTLTVYCSCELLLQTTHWLRFTSQRCVDWSTLRTDGFLYLARYRKKRRILYFMLTEGSRFSHYLCITITMIQFAMNWGIFPFTMKWGKSQWEALNQAAPMREHRKSLRIFFSQSEIQRIQMMIMMCHVEYWSSLISIFDVFFLKWDCIVLWDSMHLCEATIFHSYSVWLNSQKWLRCWVKSAKMDAIC